MHKLNNFQIGCISGGNNSKELAALPDDQFLVIMSNQIGSSLGSSAGSITGMVYADNSSEDPQMYAAAGSVFCGLIGTFAGAMFAKSSK
jgi:hypothetical protein